MVDAARAGVATAPKQSHTAHTRINAAGAVTSYNNYSVVDVNQEHTRAPPDATHLRCASPSKLHCGM